jgi:hypothetical protein
MAERPPDGVHGESIAARVPLRSNYRLIEIVE